MPYFETSDEWLKESSLLIKARPTTAKVTSKYSVLRPDDKKIKKRQRPSKSAGTSSPDPADAAATGPIASFTLKTFDSESGACLKYRTAKAAEVGRLIACLGRLARNMAALPEIDEEILPDVPEQGTGTQTPVPESAGKDQKPATTEAKPASGGGAGGKKKKKGKK